MINISCIEALAELTEVHDRRVLTERLVRMLESQVGARAAAIYELYTREPGREVRSTPAEAIYCRDLLAPDGGELRLADQEAFARCFANEEMVVVEYERDGGQRVVYPVHGIGGVTGLLVLDCGKRLAEGLEILDYLVRIYSNYLLLLDKKERDALTGLYNRQSFDERIGNALRFRGGGGRRHEEGAHTHIAVLDIDFFKRINDRFGHLYGDEVLLLFARIMEDSFRSSDLLFRYGGEEFVVLLADVGDEEAARVLERFRLAVERYEFPKVGQVTVSGGFVALRAGEMPSVVVDKADKALYYAKENGRNRICSYDELVGDGRIAEEAVEEGEIEIF